MFMLESVFRLVSAGTDGTPQFKPLAYRFSLMNQLQLYVHTKGSYKQEGSSTIASRGNSPAGRFCFEPPRTVDTGNTPNKGLRFSSLNPKKAQSRLIPA